MDEDTYPVAGKALSYEIGAGITASEMMKLFSPPFFVLGIGNGWNVVAPRYYWGVAVLFILFGIFTILITPGSQSPYKYALAILDYYGTTTEYYNRHTRPEHSDAQQKDESLVWEEYKTASNIIAASQSDDLLEE
jgi:hypothetical protein